MSIDSNTKHIKWIDGLKGVACMLVFICHFLMAFYPATRTANEAQSKMKWKFDVKLANEPYGFIIDGNFWVCVFLIISAFVLAMQMLKARPENIKEKAGTIILRRYPRLMLPALFVALINYAFLFCAEKFDFHFTAVRNTMSLAKTLWVYVVSLWTFDNADVIGPMWTLHFLAWAAVVVVVMTVFTKREYKWMPLFYVVCLYPLRCINNYYIAVGLGVLLADVVYYKRLDAVFKALKLEKLWNKGSFQKTLAIILFIIGGYCGGYPMESKPVHMYRAFAGIDEKVVGMFEIMHILGAFLIMCSFFLWKKTEGKYSGHLLSGKFCQWLGRISMSVYLIHILFIYYMSYSVMDWANEVFGSYGVASFVTFAIVTVAVIVAAEVFNRTIEKWCNKVCQKIKLGEK